MQKNNLVTPLRLAGSALLILLLIQEAKSATVVNWGGDYVSANAALQTGVSQVNGSTLTYLYSDTNAKSPASGYVAPANKSGAFYGAFQTAYASGTPVFSAYQVENNATTDRISINISGVPTGSSISGLLFFEKNGFLAGSGTNETITFSTISTISVSVPSFGSTTRAARAAVYAEVGGQWNWYLSLDSIAAAGVLSISNASAEKWAVWNITDTTAPLNPAPSTAGLYNTLGSSFQDIGDAGFWFQAFSTSAGTASIRVDGFSLDGVVTAVPEPSVMALFVISAIVGVWCRIKRNNRINLSAQ